MEKDKLLIAQDGREFRDLIEQNFKNTNEFEIIAKTGDGQMVCTLAMQHKPSIIILDLILPGRDGFAIMEELKEVCPNAKVIVLSALSQEVFITKAVSLGAAYYMVKPCDIATLVERVRMVAAAPASEIKQINTNTIGEDFAALAPKIKSGKLKVLEEKITNIFISVGIPAHIRGYQFLREAIKMAVDSPDIINSITKRLYPSIAERFSTSSSKVERAIRHAIEVAWNRGKIENINSLFGVKVYSSADKPTNGEFIALVADKMLLEGA